MDTPTDLEVGCRLRDHDRHEPASIGCTRHSTLGSRTLVPGTPRYRAQRRGLGVDGPLWPDPVPLPAGVAPGAGCDEQRQPRAARALRAPSRGAWFRTSHARHLAPGWLAGALVVRRHDVAGYSS